MPNFAITFDFHDTLASADRWFQIEVFDLLPVVLNWYDVRHGSQLTSLHAHDAREAYRRIRLDVIRSGIEIDAVSCARRVLEQLNARVDLALIEEAVDEVMRSALDEAAPVPGAVEAIRQLTALGLPVGIVSSAVYHPFLEWTIDRFDLAGEIAAIVTSASAGYYKSRPEIYTHATRALGVRPEDCIHVGDSHEYDVVSARRAGLRSVWFKRGEEPVGVPAADLTVETLVGVAPRLLELAGLAP